MNKILDFISSICPITGDSLIDTIIFTAITAIAFCGAWKLTGLITDFLGSYDSNSMSALHWIIRFIIFIVLLFLIIGLVKCVR